MQQPEPPEPSRRPDPESPGGAYDALRRLEQRLDRASETAERLLREATARAAGGAPSADEPASGPRSHGDEVGEPGKAPPSGWQVPPSEQERRADTELELLANIVASLRDRIPPELQERIAEAIRELLLAVRALIDWYLERVDQRRREPAEVQDIPIQ